MVGVVSIGDLGSSSLLLVERSWLFFAVHYSWSVRVPAGQGHNSIQQCLRVWVSRFDRKIAAFAMAVVPMVVAAAVLGVSCGGN